MSDLDAIWADLLDWQKTITVKDEQLSRQKPIRNQNWPPVRKPAEIIVNDNLKPAGLDALKKRLVDTPPFTTAEQRDKGKQAAVPLPRQKPAEKALAEKEKGNTCFQKQDFRQAIVHYGRAIELDPSQAVYFVNRAMAYLKLQMYLEAEADCTRGLALQATNVKALWRRGMARRALGRSEEARRDFEKALEIEPDNKPVKDELNRLPNPVQPTKSTITTKGQQRQTAIERRRLPIKVVDAAYPGSTSNVPQAATASKQPATAVAPPPQAAVLSPQPQQQQQQQQPQPQPQPQANANTKVAAPTKDNSAVAKAAFTLSPMTFNIPKTNLEFERDWKACRYRGADVLYQYFQSIPPSAYGSLFRSSLESDQFEQMVDLLESHYTKEKSNQDIFNVLQGLTQVSRFDMLVMFMGSKQKKALEQLFGRMKGSVDENAIKKLAKVYGIKA
ncbi:hypothetical protein BX666DRAFT_1943668 [Dichotomocladium elegans]|nr:hypothetical protein BX666DRAFT_1943668 [Dichotomocladium elegans]